MTGNYFRLSEGELQEFLRGSGSITALLYPEDDKDLPPGHHLDTDKSWHLTHFLLTGEAWGGAEPLVNAVLGGTQVSDEDVGYGPARYLTPVQVETVARALMDISPDELWKRFDLQRVREADIYPSGWEGNHTERAYVLEYYGQLRSFFSDAAVNGDAMILYIN